jgi:hypothetical protein
MPAVPFQPRAPFLADNSGQDFLRFGNLRLPLRVLFKAVLRARIALAREVRAGSIDKRQLRDHEGRRMARLDLIGAILLVAMFFLWVGTVLTIQASQAGMRRSCG